ncbi:high affinity immunoglobulin gamma Fc receptor I-like isoform X1 [Ranitomeya variabilis]|uniref:high affinity immunoglobulin gamma Fc receptor I-like isoform X1 n=1 Tax=Ranitomeya variabilis TaxID=490064 RepID=UPI004057B005
MAVTMFVISLLIIVSLIVENAGTVVSPVVTFNPNLNKIFTGESLQMTCNVNSTEQGNVTYYWFKNDYWIHSEKTFTISSALTSDGGNYQCQTSTTDRSDSTKLEVHNGYVILQTPPNVYEGDDIILRCHHYPGHPAKQAIFFKNNAVIKDWGSEDELHIDNVNMTLSCKYKCTKQVNHHLLYYQHSDETSVSVQELFSLPTISLSPQLVKEGDQVTLTCHTRLSPHRQTTELQFAFYREGQNIREFSSTNKYEILSAKLSDSGDYKCEVQTSNHRIKKASTTLTMQVNRIGERGTSHVITAVAVTSLVLVLFLFVTALIFLYRRNQLPLPGNNHPSSKAEPVEPDDETENIYTDLDANTTRWQNFSQNPHKAEVNDLVKENHVIV